jgi:hypothetical protein
MILAAVPPAIVLLYFLKLKRHPLIVPSTYLWHKSIEDLHVNTIWQRLKRNILLLLQLLIIFLIMGALLRPSWRGTKLLGSRFIFLVDNSASMSAADVPPTRLDEAKTRAGELIDQMRSGDAAMIISFADTARVEQGFTDDRGLLRRRLEAIKPTNRSTSLLEALKLAAGLANPGRSGEDITDVRVAEAMPATLYIFSDGKFPPVTGFALGHLEPKFIPIGSPEAVNVGITAFSAQRSETSPDRLQVFARVDNFAANAVKVPAELYLDGRLVDADQVEIAPGEQQGMTFDITAADTGILRLKIKGKDQLSLDNEAWLALSPSRRTKALLVTPGNEPLKMAIETKSAREIAETRIESPEFLKTKTYESQAAGGAYDLVIFDRCWPEGPEGPEQKGTVPFSSARKLGQSPALKLGQSPAGNSGQSHMPQAYTLFVGALPPDGGWSAGEKSDVPQIIDLNAAHPLMQWIDLGDVLLAAGTPLKPPQGATTLIDSDAGVMMAIAPRESFEDVVTGFTIIEEQPGAEGKTKKFYGTNWPTRQSFPVFVRNLLEYCGAARAGTGGEGVGPGATVTLESPGGQGNFSVISPSGMKTDLKPGKMGKLSFADTGELGIYRVLSGNKTTEQFAVNLFDAGESDIRPNRSPSIKVGDMEIKGEGVWQAARKEIWKFVILIGLATLLVEWYIYNRRIY